MIDIEVYLKNGKRNYSFVTIPNNSAHFKKWLWKSNQYYRDIKNFINSNKEDYDLVDFEKSPNGKYVALLHETNHVPYKEVLLNVKFDEISASIKSRDSRIIDIERMKNSRFNLVITNNIKDRLHENHREAKQALANF